MLVKDLNLSSEFKDIIIKQGITELYPPQAEAINKGLLDGKNFVIAIPTASGKTLIALLAIFSTLIKKPGTKAIYLAPLRALASEKYEEFREIGKILNKRVAISTGDLEGVPQYLSSSDIIIATNEKFDSLIRHQASWLNEISIIVSDEVHLINDYSRGPVLEIVISLARRNIPDCQILALSATIVNADEIAGWINAELITSDWRPIKLEEGVYLDGEIYYADGKIKAAGDAKDREGYVSLAEEVVKKGGQGLVFTSSRKSAMTSSEKIGRKLIKLLSPDERKHLVEISNRIKAAGEKTKLRERLEKVVLTGAAFHHAGLVSSQRKIVEDSFKERKIKIIASTPSLAAGVNLPGRRVIIRSLTRYSMNFGNTLIPVLEYKQMAGRAGRPQYDDYGEAVILSRNVSEKDELMERYINSPTEEIYSQLSNEKALRTHLLAFIAAKYVKTVDDALDMFANTFYGYQNDGEMVHIEQEVRKALELLIEAKLVSKKEPYQVTPFGKRTSELYLDPLSANKIKNGLEKVKNRLGKIEDIIYLQLLASTPDVRTYNLSKKDQMKMYDIATKYTEEWLDDSEEYESEYTFDLFFTTIKTAYVIDLWLKEASEDQINEETGVSPGDLQSIKGRIEWMLYSSIEISKIFKWKKFESELGLINKRLTYGISEELLPLVEVSGIGRVRARSLFKEGYKSIEQIKNTPVEILAKLPSFGPNLAKNLLDALHNNTEFKSIEENIEEDKDQPVQKSLSSFFD